MKLTCTQENLRKGLGSTARVSSGSTTLPILNNVLLKTEQGGLRLSCTNLEMGVNTWIRCKVDEEGAISVPAKTFTDLINSLPNDNITLTVDNNTLFIESKNYATKIKGLGADEFPLIPQVEDENAVEINAHELRSAINQVSFAAAVSETQPEISGILFFFEDKALRLTATDRYRLAEKTIRTSGSPSRQMIVPNKALAEVYKAITGEEPVKLYFTQNQAMFKIAETEIITRLIDGNYPEYKEIIPLEFNTEIEVQTDDLVKAVRTAGIFTQTGNNVILEFEEPDKLSVTSAAGDLGESHVNVPAKVEGIPCKIIINHKYMLDGLSTIGTKSLVFKVINDNAPVVFSSKELPDYIYLIMPIKI